MFSRAQPTDRRDAFLSGCRSTAEAVVVQNPTFSEGWTVIAFASAGLGDMETSRDTLAKAHATAPHVQWLAAQRLIIRGLNGTELAASERDAQAADILTLMHSEQGATALARRYAVEPSFRELLIGVAETAPSMEQNRLLRLIRDASEAVTR